MTKEESDDFEEEKIIIPSGEIDIMRDKERVLIPVSKPTSGVAGKTGAWRIFKPVVDYNKCIKCYQCYISCPDSAIVVEKVNDYPKWLYEYCKGCGICANVCPPKAIKMVEEG